jgi:hypothetical protein
MNIISAKGPFDDIFDFWSPNPILLHFLKVIDIRMDDLIIDSLLIIDRFF